MIRRGRQEPTNAEGPERSDNDGLSQVFVYLDDPSLAD